MSETNDALPEHTGYEVVALGHGQVPVYYETFGAHEGARRERREGGWVLLATAPDGAFYLYRGSYGSCSGCDARESVNLETLADARKFATDYEPFAVFPERTFETLCRERTLLEALPANERGYRLGDGSDYAAMVLSTIVSAKLYRGWEIELRDIQDCKNQELRQRALRAFGYDRWLREVEAVTVDDDGVNQLLRAGDLQFVSVKDSSTDRRYLLRVPLVARVTISGSSNGIYRRVGERPLLTVRAAVAWTFGLDERDYHPVKET